MWAQDTQVSLAQVRRITRSAFCVTAGELSVCGRIENKTADFPEMGGSAFCLFGVDKFVGCCPKGRQSIFIFDEKKIYREEQE